MGRVVVNRGRVAVRGRLRVHVLANEEVDHAHREQKQLTGDERDRPHLQ